MFIMVFHHLHQVVGKNNFYTPTSRGTVCLSLHYSLEVFNNSWVLDMLWMGRSFLFSLSLGLVLNRDMSLFSSPGQSPGRAIVLPPASALASALAKC